MRAWRFHFTNCTLGGGLRRGLLSDVFNPKFGLFYTKVFPQFIEPGTPVILFATALLVTHAVILLTWYSSPWVCDWLLPADNPCRAATADDWNWWAGLQFPR